MEALLIGSSGFYIWDLTRHIVALIQVVK